MRQMISVAILIFALAGVPRPLHASEADRFAEQYEGEIKTKKEEAGKVMEKSMWYVEIREKLGVANYEESDAPVSSDFSSFFSEVSCTALNDNANDIEKSISFSYGQAVEDKETWRVDDIDYQTNDMSFYRIKLFGSVGKILYSDRYKDLRVIPFIGYGFRYVNFKRSNFNILNIITLTDEVSEKYYLHHLDCGVKFDLPIFKRWDIAGMGSIGYVFYNQADNSILGKIDGKGGYVVNGNLDFLYRLNDDWQLILGGFVEFQNLTGGEKGIIVWPDNELNIYSGNIGARFIF